MSGTGLAPKTTEDRVLEFLDVSPEDGQALQRIVDRQHPSIPPRFDFDADRRRLVIRLPDLTTRPYAVSGVSWSDYESLSRVLDESRVRSTFDRGALELRMPGYLHERVGDLLAKMAELFCIWTNVAIIPAGSMTLRRQDLEAGVEPDRSFYIGDHADQMADRSRVDLEIDPPPDLAIETDVTHSSATRMPVFARLGVREIWRWRKDAVCFLALQADETYAAVAESQLLPRFPVEAANRFLALGRTVSYTRWHQQFQVYLREEFPTD